MSCSPLPLPWFLDTHSGAIQSICAITALIGLVCYTCFTWTIRQATVRQVTASQRPLLVLDKDETPNTNSFYIENKGNGPALGIAWKVGQRNEANGHHKHWHHIGALAVNDWSDLPSETNPELLIIPSSGLRLHYKDMEGNFYSTVVSVGEIVLQQDSVPLAKEDCLHLVSK
jgi:hypothetical protein